MERNNRDNQNKTYSYTSRKEKIRLKIVDSKKPYLDGMESICNAKGESAVKKKEYYDKYDFTATDPEGSYTGVPEKLFGGVPVQDVDDL